MKKEVTDSLKNSPAYLAAYTIGFVPLVLTDITATSLLIGSILVGLELGAVWGAAAFFLGYVLLRFTHSLSTAIGFAARTFKQSDPHS
jgi:hypothetical protein